MGHDNGDDETSKREALAESGTMGTSRSAACDPTLSVVLDFDATNFCDKKAWMGRLDLVEQGLSKLRALPWRTVAKRVVKSFCSMFVASAHTAQAVWSEECVDVVHAQIPCRLSVDYF